MKLFYTPGTISIAVAIALEEVGQTYEAVKVDFATAEQTKPDYLAINPKGRVPALETDEGIILTETGALLDYIAALHPETGLVPTAPELAAHMRAVMYYIASTMHVAHAHKMRGARWADAESSHADMARKVPQTMRACATFVETECLRGTYVCGNSLSIADPYLLIPCLWLEKDDVPLDDFPAIRAFIEAMENRASVKAVRAAGLL
ncbi:MAG: glutathione S-transferase family protein [Sulfitobacter sp.]|nr:glutathione S-transferase family protein [Sulfitobacter sp.]